MSKIAVVCINPGLYMRKYCFTPILYEVGMHGHVGGDWTCAYMHFMWQLNKIK